MRHLLQGSVFLRDIVVLPEPVVGLDRYLLFKCAQSCVASHVSLRSSHWSPPGSLHLMLLANTSRDCHRVVALLKNQDKVALR